MEHKHWVGQLKTAIESYEQEIASNPQAHRYSWMEQLKTHIRQHEDEFKERPPAVPAVNPN